MTIDRRDCPDWMHIRQFVYLEKTCPRVLRAAIRPSLRERHEGEKRTRKQHALGEPVRRPVNPAGMIRKRWRIPRNWTQRGGIAPCGLCGVQPIAGEEVAWWGRGPTFGHALCRIAEWSAAHDAAETTRLRNAEHARRRRSLGA